MDRHRAIDGKPLVPTGQDITLATGAYNGMLRAQEMLFVK